MPISRMFQSGAKPPSTNLSLGILGAVALLTAIVYAKTLSYQFVYDDDWRIVKNPAVQTLQTPAHYLSDPRTQASMPTFWEHTYRPLPTYVHAVGYSLWGPKPAYFRMQNVIIHVLNGFLLASLGIALFNLTPFAALVAALIFTLHPIQTEGVAWISELSGVGMVFWALLSLTAWVGYRRGENKHYWLITYVSLGLGLLTRESAVCIGPALVLIDVVLFKKRAWTHYAALFAVTLGYILLRSKLLGQTAQAPFWGGSLMTNIGNVLQVVPLYFKSVLWPHDQRIVYPGIPIATTFNFAVFKGVIGAIVFGATVVWSWKKSKKLFVCLCLIPLFWLPGSNLVPLNTLFAERLIYPMMIGVAWTVALLIDKIPGQRTAKIILSAALVLILCWRSLGQLPVWKNEDSLWRNATRHEQNNFFVWACLANAQMKMMEHDPNMTPNKRSWYLDEAEKFYIYALNCSPSPYRAGEILVCLAEVNYQQGKKERAFKNREEGLRLRPDLK